MIDVSTTKSRNISGLLSNSVTENPLRSKAQSLVMLQEVDEESQSESDPNLTPRTKKKIEREKMFKGAK